MVKGQLGITAAILAILLTAGTYLLVTSDGNKKAENAARVKTERAFHAVRTVMARGGDTAKAIAQRHAHQASAYFAAARKYRTVAEAEFAKAAGGMEEGWSPDFIGLLNSKRVVIWSQMKASVAKPGTAPDFVTNRLFNAKFAESVFTGKGTPVVGELPWKEAFSEPLTGVVVPLLGTNKAVVGVLMLAWKGRKDPRELRAKGEAFRDKVDPVNVLLPRQKLEANLEAMLSDEFPEEIKKSHGILPAFVGLLDEHGVLIQRNDKSRLFVGQVLAPKSLALQTTRAQRIATTETWLKGVVQDVKTASDRGEEIRPEILRVGFAPINSGRGKLAGVLVVAWEMGDVHASRMKRLSGAQVAYLQGKNLCTATLKRAGYATLATVPQSNLGPGEWKAPVVKAIDVQGGRYLAASARIPAAGSDDFVFVVMSSVDEARTPFGYARLMVLVFGVILVIGFLLVGWMLRRYFILPLSELERGVADIVAGNTEYTFGVPSRETEGLAYSLNVLMAQLLGRPEPGDEEEEEGGEGGQRGPRMEFALGPLPDRPYRAGDSQLIPRLDENKDAHYQRVFQEYLQAMQEIGEDTTGFDLKAFRSKLEVNERMICARLKCSEVRFSVRAGSEEEGVVLQPYPVA